MCECAVQDTGATGPDTGRAPAAGPGWGRRDLLRASAVGGGSALLGMAGAGQALAAAGPAATTSATPAADSSPTRGLQVVLLGTAAGPVNLTEQAGASTALVVDGAIYLVDAGLGATRQFAAAGLDRTALRHMFITHLHSDHLMSYYDFILTGTAHARQPVAVYGPGSAGQLPVEEDGSTPGTVTPAHPTPGIKRHTEACHAAFAYSSNVFMRDTGNADPRDMTDVHEIRFPDVGASARGDTAPTMRPFTVMEDDRLKVTAVLVPHGPVFPSFAFRFDTDHGSVTFSGDTRPTPNLVELARNTDLLVHEAMSDASMVGSEIRARHMRTSHTAVSEVGSVADRSGAARLVLSHYGDTSGEGIDPARWRRTIKKSYAGPTTIGTDLMRLTVG